MSDDIPHVSSPHARRLHEPPDDTSDPDWWKLIVESIKKRTQNLLIVTKRAGPFIDRAHFIVGPQEFLKIQ